MARTTRLYRATDDGYDGPWSCWSLDRETAEAYTDNPGFGGADIIEMDADLSGVLDLRCDRSGVDFEALARALGSDDPYETAMDWRARSWMYPWEESGKIARQILAAGYRWMLYLDDYPEDAQTVVRLATD